jgi:hypothetical protein
MKKILFLFICVLLSSKSFSQETVNENKKSFDITGHYTQYGSAFSIGYIESLSSKVYIKVRVNYEEGKVKLYDYKVYSLSPSVGYTLLNIKSKFLLNAEVGGLVSIEAVKNNESRVDLNKTVFGGLAGLEAVYAFKNFSLLINGYELLTSGSNLFSNRYQVGGGIRININ